MFYRQIIKVTGLFLFLYSAILLVPLAVAAYYQFFIPAQEHPQPYATASFAVTIAISLVGASLCWLFTRKDHAILARNEALATVVLIWFVTPFIGALPFVFTGTLERFDQAYFEMVSGFTTTGATILDAKHYHPLTGEEEPIERSYCGMENITYEFYGNVAPIVNMVTGEELVGIEALSPALLFWRAFTQWLGGIGIVVLFVAFLPAIGMGSKALFQTETSGLVSEAISPRIKGTAITLLKIYIVLTVLQVIAFFCVDEKISWLDAITTAFSSISIGGFSIHNDSIAYYQNPAIEWIVIVFMILGSMNFYLHYHLIKGKFYRLMDSELILYIAIIVVFGSFISWNLVGWQHISLSGENLGVYSVSEAIRAGFFQLVSAQSTAGFFTKNYDTWPTLLQMILLLAMYLGAMAGSAGGGLKIIRVYLLFKLAKNKVESIFRPNRVQIIRFGNREIDMSTGISVLCYFLIVIALSVVMNFLYVLEGVDMETAISLTTLMINNSGMGLRAAGATSTEAFLSPTMTYLSCFIMILGRLEIYAVLVMLMPDFWRTRH